MSEKINLVLRFDENLLKVLKQKFPTLKDYRILSQSLDARSANKGRVPSFHYSLEVLLTGQYFENEEESFPDNSSFPHRPIIVGAGPCGLFCALRLLEHGVPSVILERGGSASDRMKKIAEFWRYGKFDPENNVCFGEGGAGLFSDGKLITRIKSPYINYVLKKLVEFGASPNILYQSNPHLGSNKIRPLIGKITSFLKAHGCEFRYHSKVDELLFQNKKITGVKVKGETISSPFVVLATGHSAKKMYQHLKAEGVGLAPKDFAVGVRVEHPRAVIDELQLGRFASCQELKSTRYALKYHNEESSRGVYSFCMCPGGYVLSSGTEKDGLVVNGMSNYARNGPYSNSALVVTVKAEKDFDSKSDVLAGLSFIHEIERKAYRLSQKHATGRELPAISVGEFMGKGTFGLSGSSSPSGIFKADIASLFPSFITQELKAGLFDFDRKIKGFIHEKAVLIAPETRTSAPVTILRDPESLESVTHTGLYPSGEGAGYAGGITSAAVDGVRAAMAILNKA